MKRICCTLILMLLGLCFSGTALANLTCSGERLLSNYFEVRYVHDDGSVTVYYTTTPAVQTKIRLTLSVGPGGQTSILANADEISAPTRALFGPLALQTDGKTYMNLIGDSAGDAFPKIGIAGFLAQAPSSQSKTAVFQVTGVDYQQQASFGVEQIFLRIGNQSDEDAAQIPLQCH